MQGTQLTGFDVKTNVRHYGPCLLNFHSSANQVLEKRFSQNYGLEYWLSGRCFSNKFSDLALNDADFCEGTNLSYFDMKSNPWQMANVYRLFTLQQIRFEKNGFHKLIDQNIGFQGANFLTNSVIWG